LTFKMDDRRDTVLMDQPFDSRNVCTRKILINLSVTPSCEEFLELGNLIQLPVTVKMYSTCAGREYDECKQFIYKEDTLKVTCLEDGNSLPCEHVDASR
jgi:hypothetical protein